MRSSWLAVPLVLAAFVIASACDDRRQSLSPSVPTVVIPPQANLPSDPNAIPVQLNAPATGVLHGDGHWCGMFDPLDTDGFPCQSYRLDAPVTNGSVLIHVTWPEANRTVCAVAGLRPGLNSWLCKATSPVDAKYVLSGSPFYFAVGYSGDVPSGLLVAGEDVNYSVTVSVVTADSAERVR